MKKPTIEKFGLRAISDAVSGSDLLSARDALSFAVGAVLDVSGKVLKRVKRNGECKLVIEPDEVLLTVFADCEQDAETVIKRKIRKGASVRVKGKLSTFGASAICLSDCAIAEAALTSKTRLKRTLTKSKQ